MTAVRLPLLYDVAAAGNEKKQYCLIFFGLLHPVFATKTFRCLYMGRVTEEMVPNISAGRNDKSLATRGKHTFLVQTFRNSNYATALKVLVTKSRCYLV